MDQMRASQNPLVQIAGLVVGSIVAVGAILLGAVVISLVVGLAVIAGLLLFVRVWWLNRRMERSGGAAAGPAEIQGVEYVVVKERTVEDRDLG